MDAECASDSSDDAFVPKKRRVQTCDTSVGASSISNSEGFKCSYCSGKFTSRSIALRHEKGCNNNPNSKVSVLKCSLCSSSFSRKDNLSAHLKKCHSETVENTNEKVHCSFCSSEFVSKNVALRHEKGCTKNPNHETKSFKCPKCSASFSRKDNMSFHMRKCQGSETLLNEIPSCSFCSLIFGTMKIARRHEKICSKNPNCETPTLECPNCNLYFTRKDNMLTHLKKCEVGQIKKKKINCLHEDCGVSFMTKTTLIEHLRKAHHSVIEPEQKLNFASEAEFKAWKEKEEERTYSYYSQNCGEKRDRTYLYCQHDGSDRAHRKEGTEDRITSRKNRIGQIKTGNICISKLVIVSREDESCEVTYYPSHSHELSPHDFAHHPVADSTNTFIENLIALNVPAREIHKSLQAPTLDRDNRDANVVTKNLVITERRIKQRAARRKNKLRLHSDDATSTHLLVDVLQHDKYDPILLYKPIGMGIVAGPKEILDCVVGEDIFMLGLQTKEQRELLVEGAKKILIVDDTHNVTQYENVKLLNIMVVDHNNRGWPAGHFISNCMAADVIKLFIKSLRLRCNDFNENLVINCVITDDDPALINGIEDGMGSKIRHILCQWHLDKTLKEKLREKSPQALYDSIYLELKAVISIKDQSEFLNLYNAFKKKHSGDAPKFIEYLEKYYDHRTQKWAMCYRELLGHGNINTTGHIECFHNTIKTGRFNRIPNKRMDDLIYALLDIEKDSYEARLREDILGFRESPDKIRERHERGFAISDDCIEEVSSSMWQFMSSSTPGTFYHISRIQDFCTKDHCFDRCAKPSCHGLCSHIFFCTCLDKVPLCKHVHKLQSYILKGKPCPSYINSDQEATVSFFSLKEGDLSCPASVNIVYSEENSYRRLEANLTKLSELVFKRSIPSHLVSSCDTSISDLIRKCSILSLTSADLPSLPAVRKIAPTERLKTQLSQLCPFKRKKKKASKKKGLADFHARKAAAKNDLLLWASNDAVMTVSSGEEDDCEEVPLCQETSNSKLKETALSIGIYKLSFLDLHTLSLNVTKDELAQFQSVDPNFRTGWLQSDIINAFLFSLSQTNECVYAGASELALSMSRGNTLSRLFREEMPGKTIFIFPANFTGEHWTMIVVLAKSAEILYMDPLQGKPTGEVLKCINTVKKIMSIVKPFIPKWTLRLINYCQQVDSFNCGVHICWFGHQIILESEDFTDLTDILKYREFIYDTLCGYCLKFTSSLDVCIVCCSVESPLNLKDDFAVRCSKCKRLFHASCIGFENDIVGTEDEFVCPEFDVTNSDQ